MSRLVRPVVAALMVSLVAPAAALPASDPAADGPELAVLRFYNHARSPWWDTVGAERAQSALTILLRGERPQAVMPRHELAEALAARQLWLTGELSPAAATKLGRQLRLRYLVAGTLVEYGTGATATNKRRGRKLLGLGGSKDFKVELVMRLIDGHNGATLWSDSRRGQAPIGDVVATTEGGAGSAEEAVFEQLVRPMVKSMGAELTQALAALREPQPEVPGDAATEDDEAPGDDAAR